MIDVLLYSEKFKLLAVIDQYKSFIWTDRYYESGDFELYIPASSVYADKIYSGCYIGLPQTYKYCIVEKMQWKTDEEDGEYLIVTGRSLESILDRRIVWDYTNLEAPFQDCVQYLVNMACASGAQAERSFGILHVGTSTQSIFSGMNLNIQLYGENLYETVTKMCKDRGVSYKITMETLGQMEFLLYAGTDRSYAQTQNAHVVFSPSFDNLANSELVSDTTEWKNDCLITGEGEKSLKVRAEARANGYVAGLNRRETYIDSGLSKKVNNTTLTDLQYWGKMMERGYEELSKSPNYVYFDGEAADTKLYRYGIDFFLGDIVQLEDNYGNTGRSRVIEYIRTYTEEEEKEYPTFSGI